MPRAAFHRGIFECFRAIASMRRGGAMRVQQG
jgi:hypothetical protein